MWDSIFQRTELLLGHKMMTLLSNSKVIIFGVGGVGGWCAEGLVRSGIGNLTIVDFDDIVETNVNRQIIATTSTVGKVKVDILKERLNDINPHAIITPIKSRYSEDNCDEFDFNNYDYVIDAIDSIKDKALLIYKACQSNATLFSSMGAALKSDILLIKTNEFWKVKGDPLAAALRRYFKKNALFPNKKFKCVYSEERLKNKMNVIPESSNGKTPNGTLMPVTASFGLILANMLIQDVVKKNDLTSSEKKN